MQHSFSEEDVLEAKRHAVSLCGGKESVAKTLLHKACRACNAKSEDTDERVLDAIRSLTKGTKRDIAGESGFHLNTVTRSIRRLDAKGLVEQAGDCWQLSND